MSREDPAIRPTLALARPALPFCCSEARAMASPAEAISAMPALNCRAPEAKSAEMPTTWATRVWILPTKTLKWMACWAISSVPAASSRAVRSPWPSEMSCRWPVSTLSGFTMALPMAHGGEDPEPGHERRH